MSLVGVRWAVAAASMGDVRTAMNEASETSTGRVPEAERPKRGTTLLPDGGKMVYDGELTVLDKDGELVSWASSDLLAMMWGDEEGEEGELPPPRRCR